MIITGVATQGHGDFDEWVTQYNLVVGRSFFVSTNSL